MSQVNVALLGCGGMGGGLIRAAAELDLGHVVCVADPDTERAAALAAELGCEHYAEAAQALARADVDAVFIAAPNFLHPPLTIQAAEAGKHIFCEKPMALHAADARAMIEAARSAGVKLMIGQVLRYIPPYSWMLDLARSGKLGRPFCAQITRIGGLWATSPWRQQAELVGGGLFEISAHEIDFLRVFLGGNATRVYARMGRYVVPEIDYEDTVHVLLDFENGTQGCLFGGQSAFLGSYDGKLLLTEGTIYFDSKTGEVNYARRDEEPVKLTYEETGAGYEPGVRREVREFLEAVAQDTPVTIPGEEGLQNTMVAEAARLSSDRGAPVDLPY